LERRLVVFWHAVPKETQVQIGVVAVAILVQLMVEL